MSQLKLAKALGISKVLEREIQRKKAYHWPVSVKHIIMWNNIHWSASWCEMA